jgi:hypothetical protein
VETSRREFTCIVDVMLGQMKTPGLLKWRKKIARCCSLDDVRFSRKIGYKIIPGRTVYNL